MGKSKGKRKKTRSKLKKNIRDRGKIPTRKIIQEFPVGTKAAIKINPSVQKGQPHSKFHGRTGTIVGKQGKSYIIEIREGNKTKKIISRGEHLKKVEE